VEIKVEAEAEAGKLKHLSVGICGKNWSLFTSTHSFSLLTGDTENSKFQRLIKAAELGAVRETNLTAQASVSNVDNIYISI
jgi:hypothetical protein